MSDMETIGEEDGSAADADPVLSVLIVSFNTRLMTLDCVRSVFEETQGIDFEVIVVDNASSDGSAAALREAHPNIHLIALEENIGFARANNLAAESARGKYLLLLNPDTLVLRGALKKLVEFMETHPDAGACGGRTYLADGSLDPGSCWGKATPWSTLCRALALSSLFPGSRLFDRESLGGWKRDSVKTVDVVTGCLLIIQRRLWQELNGFDPRFFMYAEDQDLCLRVAASGRRCWICPEAEIIHYRGASEKVHEDKVVRLCAAKSLLFQKHWKPGAAAFGIWAMNLHAWVRVLGNGVAALFSRRAAESCRTWKAIWRRRSEWRDIRLDDLDTAPVARGDTSRSSAT